MNPKLSIIIPAYNAEKTIKRCIQSVLDNAFSDYEIIIIDDGSKDDTARLVMELSYLDSRIRLITKKNGGVSSARNRGIKESKAPYIMFLDSDDTYESICCEKTVSLIESQNADIVMFSYFEIFNNKKKIVLCPITHMLDSQEEIYSKIIFNHYMSGVNGYIGSVWMAGFKRSVIVENNIRFNESLHHSEDKLFLLNYLFFCNRLAVIDEPLYNYELGDSSVTKKYSASLEENHKIYYEELEKLLNQFGHKTNPEQKSQGAVSYVFSIILNEVREGNPKSFGQKIKKVVNTSKEYRSSAKMAHPTNRNLKIKRFIAIHPSLCVGFFLIRRVQRALGVYF